MTPEEEAAIRAQVEVDRAAGLNPYQTGQKNAQGRVICGARRHRIGLPCQSAAIFPNGRCRFHGGKAPAGVAHANFKHGRYSKHLPANLLDRYQAALADADLRALDDEIALVYARQTQVLDRLGTGEGQPAWARVKAAHTALVEAFAAKQQKRIEEAIEDLGAAIEKADTERDTWNQLLALIERRRKLVKSKARVEALGEQAVAARELMVLAEDQATRDANDAYLGLPVGQPEPLGRAPGEPLTPQRYSRPALVQLRTDLGEVAWSAEYQGVPRPREGAWFRREWFAIVDAAPRPAQRVRYWDKAGTKDGGGAYTAGVLLARAADGVVYVEDVVRGQWSAGAREPVIKQTAELDAQRYGGRSAVVVWVEQEPGSGGKESAESTIKNLAGFVAYADHPTGDKDTRLYPFEAQARAGNVRLVRGAWNGAYIEELTALPNGRYRDQADATAGAFNKLAALGPPAWDAVQV